MYAHFQKKARTLGELPRSWWDLVLAPRVARQVLADAGDGEEEESSSGQGVSGLFLRYLDEVWEKGNKKVPNPNIKTKKKYPKVSFNTAFKDPAFKKKVLADFAKWKKKDKGGKKQAPKKETKAPKPSSSKPLMKVDEGRVKRLAAEFKSEIDKHIASVDVKELRSFLEKEHAENNRVSKKEAREIMARMSDKDLQVYSILINMPPKIKKLFTSPETSHSRTKIKDFVSTVTSNGARQLMGALSSLGIQGSVPDYEEGVKDVSKYRDLGESDKNLQASAKAMYEATQAFFQALGMDRVKVYRGMNSINDPSIKNGDQVTVRSREVTSTTIDPGLAYGFGRVVEYDIPVSQIFTLPNMCGASTYPDEVELMAAGMDDTPGTVVTKVNKTDERDVGVSLLKYQQKQKKKGMKMADKTKPKVIQPTREDDDWLAEMRKKKKDKSTKNSPGKGPSKPSNSK